MSIKLAIVDFDGTLADSMPFWLDKPRAALQAAGLPEPAGFEERLHTTIMWDVAAYLTELYPQMAAERSLRDRWREQMAEDYRRRIPLKPGAEALLALLRRQNVRVFIVSATDSGLLEEILDRFGLRGYVERVFDEATVGSKAAPAPYLYCMALAGVRPEETVLVEDSLKNLRQGAALGLGTVGVREGTMAGWEAETRALADVFLDERGDLSDLEAFLRKKA